MTTSPFERAVAAIRQANSADPRTTTVNGVETPWEVAHADALVRWVRRLVPEPSEALVLAAHGQHIRRWEHPRDEFPDGRTGYLRWRTMLYGFHTAACARLLQESGVAEATVRRVEQLVSKKAPPGDVEAQALEDGLCLVFLESQFAALAGRLAEDKTVDVVRKTWRKMSPAAREAALSLPLSPSERDIIQRALSPA